MDDDEKTTHVPSRILNRKLDIILVLVIINFLVFVGALVYYYL